MSVFPTYEEVNGDLIPTGGVFVPSEILSMIFQSDVEDALKIQDLETWIYQEALSVWTHFRQSLLLEEEIQWRTDGLDWDETQVMLLDDMTVKRPLKRKRGQDRMKRHLMFEKQKRAQKATR
jgi:hypothetical protein